MTIALPEKSDNRIEQWCQREAGLPVIYPKALVEMLVPLSGRKVSGEIQVYANDEIIVDYLGAERRFSKASATSRASAAKLRSRSSKAIALQYEFALDRAMVEAFLYATSPNQAFS